MRACISLAVKREMPVIPIFLPGTPAEPELPPLLANFSWLDARGGISGDVLARLEWGIRGHRTAAPAPLFPNERAQALAERMAEAAAPISGGETSGARAEVLALKRELREGQGLTEAPAPKAQLHFRTPLPGEERIHAKDGSVLVYVPGGRYPMGEEGRKAKLPSFWIGKYPVTCQQYAALLGAWPRCDKPALWADERYNQPQQPVAGLSQGAAVAYCRWAGLVPAERDTMGGCGARARGPALPLGGLRPDASARQFQ